MSTGIVRATVLFRGEVQGVGFRYTAKRIASNYPEITGTVRNLPDGSVELVAEGEKKEIVALINSIRSSMNPYISDVTEAYLPADRAHNAFHIVL